MIPKIYFKFSVLSNKLIVFSIPPLYYTCTNIYPQEFSYTHSENLCFPSEFERGVSEERQI